jgi:hypothetical protein
MKPEDQEPADGSEETSLQISHTPSSDDSVKPQDAPAPQKTARVPTDHSQEVKEIEEAYKKRLDSDKPQTPQEPPKAIFPSYTPPAPSMPAVALAESPVPAFQDEGSAQSTGVYTDEIQEQLVQKTERRNERKKRLIKIFGSLSVFVIIIGGVVGWYFLIYIHVGSKKFTVSNDSYKYSFVYYSDSIEGLRGTYNQLSGRLKDPVVVLPSRSSDTKNCDSIMPSPTVVFQASFQDKSYPVCLGASKASLLTTFEYKGTWQQIALYSIDGKTPIDIGTTKKLLSSLTITN